jgi:hypothetical protein
MTTCSECPNPIKQTPGHRDRITCGDNCRKRRQLRLRAAAEERFRRQARELLRRQAEAIAAGDEAVLAAVQRDAARLFGEAA